MKRGEIYYIESNYKEVGDEMKAGRPAVIVSNDKNNEHSNVVEIAYLTTQAKKDLPTHVFTRNAPAPSTILCENIYSVSKQRIGQMCGQLSESEILALDAALAISLGLDICTAPVMREPTEEELQQLFEEMKKGKLEALPVTDETGSVCIETNKELIKLTTERDLYRQLYNELLGKFTKGA